MACTMSDAMSDALSDAIEPIAMHHMHHKGDAYQAVSDSCIRAYCLHACPGSQSLTRAQPGLAVARGGGYHRDLMTFLGCFFLFAEGSCRFALLLKVTAYHHLGSYMQHCA